MFRFLKSTSRTVVHEEEEEEEQKTSDDHGGGGCMTSLTVWTKSLVISCNGFTVIDSNGNLVYRVDNYSARPEEVTLMDASGKPVHTMRRRKVIDNLYIPLFISLSFYAYRDLLIAQRIWVDCICWGLRNFNFL
jgi:hypothetical protein